MSMMRSGNLIVASVFGITIPRGSSKFLEELAGCSLTHQRYATRARVAFEQAYCDEQTLPLLDHALAAMLTGDGVRKQSLAA